jgi:hypothetical protein
MFPSVSFQTSVPFFTSSVYDTYIGRHNRVYRLCSSSLLSHVAFCLNASFSEEHTATIFRPEVRNVRMWMVCIGLERSWGLANEIRGMRRGDLIRVWTNMKDLVLLTPYK